MTTPLLQYAIRFYGDSEVVGFGWGCYKKSQPWCSLFVGFSSLFVAPSGERLAFLMCWRGTSLSTTSRFFVVIFFSAQRVVVDVERVGFRPRAVVVWRGGVVAGCTRTFPTKNMLINSNPRVGYMQ